MFTRQMAALYNKDAYDGKERVLEMHFTDLDHTYQIWTWNQTGSQVVTDGSLSSNYPHQIHLLLYGQRFLEERLVAQEALGKQMYTVSGDFSLDDQTGINSLEAPSAVQEA